MKKFSNKILIGTLLILAAIFVATKVFRSPGMDSNLDDEIFRLDTAKITEIRLQPQKDTLKELKLIKSNDTWTVTRENITSKVQTYQIKGLLGSIATLKPERIVSRKKEKWNQYNVNDSTATKVSILGSNGELLDIKIGKEVGGITYARIGDENEIYGLDGYLTSQFNKSFNDWRDQSLLRINKDHITKISFQYPADSGFVIEKKDKAWMIGNEKADSARVEDYFGKIRSKDHNLFADHFKPNHNPDVTLTLTTDSNNEIIVKAWRGSFYQWILNSSVQPETYFLDEGPKVVPDIFIGKSKLLPK